MTYHQPARPVPACSLLHPLIRLSAGIAMALAITAPAMAQPKQAQETVVRLNGSSTTGNKMTLGLATAWAKQLKLSGVHVEAGLDPDEYEVIAEGAESVHRMRVQVKAKGSAFGLEPMLRGQADIWLTGRAVRESDLETMKKRNVPNVPTLAQMQQPGIENVIALSALVIVVNTRNPVPALSMAQLRDMYSGRVTSWAQVGGPSNMPIGLYSPEPTQATADFFCGAVIGNADTLKCLDAFPRLAAPRIQLIDDVSDAVAANPAGISFVDFAARRSTRPIPISTECGGSIEPSLFRIKTDEYPLTRKHYAYVMPGRTLTPAVRDFLQLMLGPIGQAAAAAAGLGDLTPSVADANYGADRVETARETMDGGRTRVRATDVRAFETATAGADRLTVTFRFQAGTNNLDSRAEADLERLSALMQQPPYSQSAITLIGYSGVAGDYSENRILSRERADAIRDRLRASGIQNVSSVGVGPTAAVACNLDPNTAPQNQRVEVWVHKPRAG